MVRVRIGLTLRSPAHTPWARELQRGTLARSARYPPPFSSSFPAPGQIVAGRPGNAGACVLGYFLFPPSHPHSWHGPAGYEYRTWNKGYKYRTATHITVARSTTINWDVSARTWKGCPRPSKGDGHAQAGRSPTYGAHLSPFFSLVLSCLRTAAGTVESGRLTDAGWLNIKWQKRAHAGLPIWRPCGTALHARGCRVGSSQPPWAARTGPRATTERATAQGCRVGSSPPPWAARIRP